MARRLLATLGSAATDLPTIAQSVRGGFPAPSGGWNMPPNLLGTAAGSALVSGTAFFWPLDLSNAALQSLGCNVTTAQVGGTTTTTLGLYGDDGSGGAPNFAGGLLASGTVVLTTTGVKTAAITYTPTPGRYWSAFLWVASVAPGTVPILTCATNATSLWCPNANFPTVIRCFTLTGLSALPTTAQTLAGNGGSTGVIVGARAT